ncbi:alpha/beta hydrolase [Actinoplanes sp. ATCC 53533]|uniref:RBBP9/YdeN family alpha/beta hydrolase n=1 Tax=Actinoplanes sp. ATCC 53533 TaxID=1288362 RepID=UPI001F300505|nr:alpha/beta fold hydrolase [Actinoplanes sp. ATCC 53533]
MVVPGVNGSGADHWQSRWQARWGTSASRISPSSWDEPNLADWCQAIDRAVTALPAGVVLVAHSLGCLAATQWATRRRRDVAGMFLVAPPDQEGPNFPADTAPTFTGLTAVPLDVPGLMVVSDNDLYCTAAAAWRLAAGWKLDCVSAGRAGHLNAASGVGSWDFGHALLTAFTAGTGARHAGIDHGLAGRKA